MSPRNSTSIVIVVEHDPTHLRFAYRTEPDDDNPSFAMWSWRIAPHPLGNEVTVSWSVNPRPRIRRWILAPIRSRRLRAEVPASLQQLCEVLEAPATEHVS